MKAAIAQRVVGAVHGLARELDRYEARQQIPFALEDVIWDYQTLGGAEEGGFILDAEVGLFAIKKEVGAS